MGLSTDTAQAVNVTRVEDWDPLDVNTFKEDVLTSQTDVIVYDYDYEGDICLQPWKTTPSSAGVAGFYRCLALVPGGSKCDQARLDFDLDYMGHYTADEEEWLACHEIGHSFGLDHTTDNHCMDPLGPNTSNPAPHDRDRIQNNYP